MEFTVPYSSKEDTFRVISFKTVFYNFENIPSVRSRVILRGLPDSNSTTILCRAPDFDLDSDPSSDL